MQASLVVNLQSTRWLASEHPLITGRTRSRAAMCVPALVPMSPTPGEE
jgi:hypothetical protein